MSLKELLREFKALATAEQKQFLREVRGSQKQRARVRRVAKKVEWPDVESRALQATGGRIVNNVVLAEREESPF